MDSICEIVERLDDLLVELEEYSVDDSLHVILELGHQFRDELNSLCEDTQ